MRADQLQKVLPDVDPKRIDASIRWYNESLTVAGAVTPQREALLIANTAVETMGLKKFEEDLDYSAQRIVKVWPHRFSSVSQAAFFSRNAKKLANHVYADRLGNGDEASGDGWKYRGRASLMITGCTAYRDCGVWLGVDLVGNPDIAAQLEHAYLVGAWYWRSRGLNAIADLTSSADERAARATVKITGAMTEDTLVLRQGIHRRALQVFGLAL